MSVLSPEIVKEKIDNLELWKKCHEDKHEKDEEKIDAHFNRVYKKIDRLLYWIMGLMATALIAVLAFILNK
jgi:hypothetical protein